MLHSSCRPRRLLTGFVAVTLLFSAAFTASTPVQAAQPDGKKAKTKQAKPKIIGDQPIAVIAAASANRMLEDVEHTFKSIDKSEIYDLLTGFIAGFGDLKGMDRDKPFGVMVFLNSGIPPTPAPVGYIPVKNMADLAKSLSNGPFTVKEVEGQKDRYEIVGLGRRRSIFLGVKNGYAFVTDNIDSLDREFPDPAKFAAPLAKRYDLSFSVNMNSIAKESRTLLSTVFRSAAEAEIQQRDGESETAYQARRANDMRRLDWIEGFILDCETALIGIDTSKKNKNLMAEFAIDARPNSKFAKMLKAIGGKKSYFHDLLDEKSPFAASVSWGLDNKVDREATVQGFRMMAAAIALGLDRNQPNGKKKPEAKPDENKEPGAKENNRRRNDPRFDPNLKYPVGSPIARTLEPIMELADKRQQFDAFVRVVGEPPAKFSMIGGMQVLDGKKMAKGLADLMRQLQGRDGAPEITINAETHKGISFHRVKFPQVPGPMRRFFGDSPSLLVGASSRAMWMVMGSEGAFNELRKSIDLVIERKDFGKKKQPSYPFRVAVNVAGWLAMAGEGGGRGREIARKAFEKGGDGVRVELRTVENGLRARLQLDEGFIRFLGLNIANQIDRNRAEAP